MSSTKSVKSAPAAQVAATVEELVAQIRALADVRDCLILVGTFEPEVSGVMLDEAEAAYREVVPLGEGIHIVVSVDLPTKMPPGIHEEGE